MNQLSNEDVAVAAPEVCQPDSESRGFIHSLAMLGGRSVFPIAALIIIVGTLFWGPWVTLLVAWLWWRIVGRFA